MARRPAKITHDEVTRMVKAVQACDLPVRKITFDGDRLDVIIGEPDPVDVDKEDGPKKPKELETL